MVSSRCRRSLPCLIFLNCSSGPSTWSFPASWQDFQRPIWGATKGRIRFGASATGVSSIARLASREHSCCTLRKPAPWRPFDEAAAAAMGPKCPRRKPVLSSHTRLARLSRRSFPSGPWLRTRLGPYVLRDGHGKLLSGATTGREPSMLPGSTAFCMLISPNSVRKRSTRQCCSRTPTGASDAEKALAPRRGGC